MYAHFRDMADFKTKEVSMSMNLKNKNKLKTQIFEFA